MDDSTETIETRTEEQSVLDAIFRLPSPWKIPREGEIVEGTILKKAGSVVFINLGFGVGIIFGKEYHEGRESLKQKNVGDIVVAKVVLLENEDGYTELSIKEAGREKFWKETALMLADKQPIVLRALEANRGGLVFEWKGVKGFMPVSQLSHKNYPKVEGGDKTKILEELQKFVGQEFTLQVITADPREEKLIFSEKATSPQEALEKIAHYTVGETYTGVVSGVVEFGLFVRLEEGLEGLVHISEIDWSLVDNPADLYKVGDSVSVKIIAIEGDKVSLSIKALKPDPWKQVSLEKGDIVEGTVTKLNKYGAFVRLNGEGKDGLCGLSHVSEFGSLQKMRETVEVGKSYPFQIVVFQPDNHKLSLAFLGGGEKPLVQKETHANATPAREEAEETSQPEEDPTKNPENGDFAL